MEEKRKRIRAVCFTRTGAVLLERLAEGLASAGMETEGWKKGKGPWPEGCRLKEATGSLTEWMGEAWKSGESVLVIGAAGIAVRAATPWIRDKFQDPAVVVMDEQGRFAIPLLSGHWGGANALASLAAEKTGGRAVLTTATDVEGRFAVDVFARENGLWMSDRQAAKRISADVLAGIPVKVVSDFPQEGRLPQGLLAAETGREGKGPDERQIVVSVFGFGEKEGSGTLFLVPRLVTLGIGCRKDIPAKVLKTAVMDFLQQNGIWPAAVKAAATIDRKGNEPALLALCREMGWELRCYSAGELQKAEGTFAHSDFVEKTTGVGNVCERAAVLAGGRLIAGKQKGPGVTAAAALAPWTLQWEKKDRENSGEKTESRYTYVGQTKMRMGITTGTCAAAASLGAASLLLEGKRLEQVTVLTPRGIRVSVPVFDHLSGSGFGVCSVRKDAGDDPDVTDGIRICVRVEENPASGGETGLEGPWYSHEEEGILLYLRGGEGIGMATRPGLSCPPGMWAINPVPRQMIFRQVSDVLRRTGKKGPLYITVSAPEAIKLAEKTFNPQLGIQGGISILGTSGIVEPMSQAALTETIGLEIRQKAAEGETVLLATPGNYGLRFLEETLGLPAGRAVKCSNFIGETIDLAARNGFCRMLFAGHAGKLIKVAAGIMNTHSSAADGRMECLAAWAGACGGEPEQIRRILSAVTADEALGILEEKPGLREEVMEKVMERMAGYLRKRGGENLTVEAVMFTNDRGILGMTAGAEEMIRLLRQEDGKITG